MKKALIAISVLIFLGLGFYLLAGRNKENIQNQLIQPVAYKDLIEVEYPLSGQIIKTPIQVSGKARGNWYFEASFPVQVLDEDGTILGQGPAQAQGDWMTDEYVPFSASIDFKTPRGKTGKIIFKKDNPSGDPAKDDSISVPVSFE